MEQRDLGAKGITVSELALGTLTFGNETDQDEAARIVNRFLDAGGNLIDTADAYSKGGSEEVVGRAIRSRRNDVVLATKGGNPMGDDPWDRSASRRYLTGALDASLRRLGTDYVDLYQVHWPDFTVPLEETLGALDDFVRAGKVRFAGVSNYLPSQVAELLHLSERNNWVRLASLQVQYSLACRDIELETVPLCQARRVAVLAWSPLVGGTLTGKYRLGVDPPAATRMAGSRLEATRLTERNLTLADEVSRIAHTTGRTNAQVALNWVLHRPGLTAAIVGVRTVAQLEDNLGATGWRLEDEHAAALSKSSRTDLPHPHDMYRMLKLRTYS